MTTYKKVFGIILCLITIGCAASIKGTTKVSYVNPSFTISSLQQDGLGILPITAGAGLEGYRRPFGNFVNHYSDSLSTTGMILSPWQETMTKLNDADMADEYNEAITNYNQTSIIDKSFLNDMGQAIGTRYFLFIQLGNFEQDSDLNYSMFSGFTTTKTNEVSAYAQLWDASNGDVVWEAVSNASAASSSELVTVSDNPSEYSQIIAKGLMEKLF